jgi:hypothetical protein
MGVVHRWTSFLGVRGLLLEGQSRLEEERILWGLSLTQTFYGESALVEEGGVGMVEWLGGGEVARRRNGDLPSRVKF